MFDVEYKISDIEVNTGISCVDDKFKFVTFVVTTKNGSINVTEYVEFNDYDDCEVLDRSYDSHCEAHNTELELLEILPKNSESHDAAFLLTQIISEVEAFLYKNNLILKESIN